MKFSLASIPRELELLHSPIEWRVQEPAQLLLVAGERTDWFYDPASTKKSDNAPAALFATRDENFVLSARVEVEFASTFDAGVLQIRVKDDVWGKLCFEYSPQKQPMIVSVVTRGVSDDCNSAPIENNEVYLRVARIGQAFAFHSSRDGKFWNFVRNFALGNVDKVHVGFSAQSPTGRGCSARFSEIGYRQMALAELRNGD